MENKPVCCGLDAFASQDGKEFHCPSCGKQYVIKNGKIIETGWKLMPMALPCGHIAPMSVEFDDGTEICINCAIKRGISVEMFKEYQGSAYDKISQRFEAYQQH